MPISMCTRFCYMYNMLKTKDKALRYFKIYKDDINRIDYCGREYFSNWFSVFLVHIEHGIIYDVDDKKQFLYLNRLYTGIQPCT